MQNWRRRCQAYVGDYALVPCVCNIVGFGVAMTFPITQPVHQKILDVIEKQRQGILAPDPLR